MWVSTNTKEEVKMMIDQLTYIADVKVGKVKGNSRVYPQLRLPSQYAKLTGKIASIYEMSEREGDIAFVIRFDSSETKGLAAYHERAERAEANFVRAEPCRGSDSGSNPDSGALFFDLSGIFAAELRNKQLKIFNF
ncbi:MAG: hypothetical protein ACXV3T_07530 [Halobacteriota archaeon]